jgi:hypothetical protein
MHPKEQPQAMRKTLAAGALAAIAASLALVSTGVASASPSPDMSGKAFSVVQAALKAAGLTPVVSTTVGDKLPQSDCLVVRQQNLDTVPFGTKQYQIKQNNVVLLSLNCNPGTISSGSA